MLKSIQWRTTQECSILVEVPVYTIHEHSRHWPFYNNYDNNISEVLRINNNDQS